MREPVPLPSGGDPEAGFNPLALELFALQYEHNPVLRKLCAGRGVTPATVTEWRQIPAMAVAAFKDLEVTSLPEEQRIVVFHSSGTTGHKPSRHFHDAESLALYEASLLPWFEAHLLPSEEGPTERLGLICLTPAPAHAPHSSLVQMLDSIRRRFPWRKAAFLGRTETDGSWSLHLHRLVSLLEMAARTGLPVVLLGTAFSFVQLLDHLVSNRLHCRLPGGSRMMETGGYKGRSRALPKAELHHLIADRLGLGPGQIVCEYGMSEASSQAYDHRLGAVACGAAPAGGVFRFPPWARVQIISPETNREVSEGETGLIRLFDLANLRSVLGLQTEDLGVRRADGFELIGRAALTEARGCSLLSLETSTH
jgi:hypothetical protein